MKWALATWAICLIGPPMLNAGEWPWTRWEVDCRDPDPCEPADEIYDDLLEHASVWLDGLGFGAPKILVKERINPEAPGAPRQMFYFAEVSNVKNEECKEEERKSVGKWVCFTCSNEVQREVLVCEEHLDAHYEDHYLEEMIY